MVRKKAMMKTVMMMTNQGVGIVDNGDVTLCQGLYFVTNAYSF